MGKCPAQSFRDITPDRWQALIEKGAQNQFSLGGDSGQSTDQEFTFCWQYDATSSILTIQCLDHPFLVSCGEINEKVAALVSGTQSTKDWALTPVKVARVKCT